MALFRKFFYRKPPDGLLEISERVYVFDCCFSTDVLEEDNYKVYMGGIVGQLREHLPEASFMVFNFREGERQSQIASILSEYDMTVMDYPRHYEGCPLLTMEVIHHFLRSSESWLSLGHQNVLLMHCERGGWPVLAFMLAALLIYRKQYSGELKTLDMIYKQAPRELMQLLSPLDPLPSQLRYLHYVSRRNVGLEWPPLDRALTLDCIILRILPDFDGEGGCRPIFRIYGPDPFIAADRTPKVLFSTPKKSKTVRLYKQADCELVKIDINCHIQGDVVLECISLDEDLEREEMMFRVMFNTAFIRSNILMLNRDEIDILWNAKDRFPKNFRAEVLLSEMDTGASLITVELPSYDEKDGLPMEAFSKVQEIFSSVDWLDPKADVALNVLQKITASNILQEKLDPGALQKKNTDALLPDMSPDKVQEKLKPALLNNIKSSTSMDLDRQPGPSLKPSPESTLTKKTVQPQEVQVGLQRPTQPKIISQRIPHSSLSCPVSESNSLQSSPVTTSRYQSAPSALGITALLHDHASYGSTDVPHPVTAPPSPSPSTPLPKPKGSSIVSVPPAPTLPPAPAPISTMRPLLVAPKSITSSSPPAAAAPPPPPPPPPHHTPASKLGSDQLQHFPAPPPPPPPPPPFSGVTVNKPFPAPPPPPPPVPPVAASSTPPPPPPPPPTNKPSVTARPPPPPPPPLSSPSSKIAASAPPPPPPPSSASKNPSGPTSQISPHPPMPPPPAPFARGVPKVGGASPTSLSVGNNVSSTSVRPPTPAPPLNAPFSAKGRGPHTTSPRNAQSAPSKKTSLKPLHWLKLTRAMQGSLWAEAQRTDEASKAPEFDMSELESLFSAAGPNSDRGSSSDKSNRRASLGSKSDKVQLIDLRRAYNCEIMLTKVKIPLPDLMGSVLALDDSALDVDQVDNLIKFCPTKEEMDLLKGYSGDKENLGKCEQFFLELMKVPRVESKLRVFSFKIQFSSQVSDLRKNLNVVNSAAEEIRNSAKLKRIMQTILSLGNALNQGTARGSAIGFRLDSLLKLIDTRARNNKMTLMHYLCKVLADKLPELLDFQKDLVSLEASSKIQLKYLAEEMQAISKGLEKVEQELTASENDGPVSQTFRKTLKEFLVDAESEVRSLASLYSGVGRSADALALYFGEDPARCPFEQVVSTLVNFVRMFARAHDENCKQLELERKRAQKEAESEKVKVGTPKNVSEQLGHILIKKAQNESESEKMTFGTPKKESQQFGQTLLKKTHNEAESEKMKIGTPRKESELGQTLVKKAQKEAESEKLKIGTTPKKESEQFGQNLIKNRNIK